MTTTARRRLLGFAGALSALSMLNCSSVDAVRISVVRRRSSGQNRRQAPPAAAGQLGLVAEQTDTAGAKEAEAEAYANAGAPVRYTDIIDGIAKTGGLFTTGEGVFSLAPGTGQLTYTANGGFAPIPILIPGVNAPSPELALPPAPASTGSFGPGPAPGPASISPAPAPGPAPFQRPVPYFPRLPTDKGPECSENLPDTGANQIKDIIDKASGQIIRETYGDAKATAGQGATEGAHLFAEEATEGVGDLGVQEAAYKECKERIFVAFNTLATRFASLDVDAKAAGGKNENAQLYADMKQFQAEYGGGDARTAYTVFNGAKTQLEEVKQNMLQSCVQKVLSHKAVLKKQEGATAQMVGSVDQTVITEGEKKAFVGGDKRTKEAIKKAVALNGPIIQRGMDDAKYLGGVETGGGFQEVMKLTHKTGEETAFETAH